METLSVGMYVRTKNGNIRKIVELTNTKFIDEPDYYVDKVLIDIEQNEREDTIYMEKWLFNDDIIKASYNITDLIEVGDIITFKNDKDIYRVNCIPNKENGCECFYLEFDYADKYGVEDIRVFIEEMENDLESIVTKEQFSSMEYRLGDNK